MTKMLRGIVHGKTIELENETGLEDGRQVEIILRTNTQDFQNIPGLRLDDWLTP